MKIKAQKDKSSTGTVYVEDLLQREEFSLNELKEAKHRHPFKHWLKLQRFFVIDAVETFILKFHLWLARL